LRDARWTAAATIYSLGVMAYHMLSGAPAFTGDTPLAVAVQHLSQSPAPLASRRPSMPTRFAAVIDRMLAKKAGRRYADPQALLRELHALATEGAQGGWSSGPEHWSFAELVAAADGRRKPPCFWNS